MKQESEFMLARINDAKNELICINTGHHERDTRVFDVKSSEKNSENTESVSLLTSTF